MSFTYQTYWPYEKTLETCVKEAARTKMAYGMFPDDLVNCAHPGWTYWYGGPLHELLEQGLPVTQVVLPGGRVIKTKPKEFVRT